MGKGFALHTVGGDARMRGGLALGAVAHGGKVLEKPDGDEKRPAGESIHRGGGHGLASGGKEKPGEPRTKVVGESIPRGGGTGLGTSGKEKPNAPGGGPDAGHYADPGYQADGKHRLPVHTEKHTRASLRIFQRTQHKYGSSHAQKVGAKLEAARKQFNIDRYENATRK